MNKSISAPTSLDFYVKQIILTPSEENFKLPNVKPEALLLFGLKCLLVEMNGCYWCISVGRDSLAFVTDFAMVPIRELLQNGQK